MEKQKVGGGKSLFRPSQKKKLTFTLKKTPKEALIALGLSFFPFSSSSSSTRHFPTQSQVL